MQSLETHNVHNEDTTSLLPNVEENRSKKKTPMYYLKIVIVFVICLVAIYFIIAFIMKLAPFQESKKSELKAAMIGLWPTYGGGLKNQQRSPNPQNVLFTPFNIKYNTRIKCVYESNGGRAFMGYPTIDNDNNTYFTDASGYITCINLDTCEECWRSHVGNLLGFADNISVTTHQTLTIFRDSNGDKGLLFGAPSNRGLGGTYADELGCYALAVHLNNGSFWWKIQIGQDLKGQDFRCGSHGFYVDGIYGYGGMGQSCCYRRGPDDDNNFIGGFIKINIDKHTLVDRWYPFDYNLTYKNNSDEYNLTYSGITSYNYPAVDDDYVVFGTSNIWTIPYKIQQCMLAIANNDDTVDLNDYLAFNQSVSMDVCGNEKSNNPWFRCLPKTVYPSSLIILDKKTFSLKYGYRLIGLDVIDRWRCSTAKTCPGHYFNDTIFGFNGDLTAVSIYKNKLNKKKYVIAVNKAGNLYSFELETGKLHFVKKYAPQTTTGQFNLAIDEDNMIAIATMNGGRLDRDDWAPANPRYDLPNNIRVCAGTGVAVAFDLNTGKTLYEIINPYGTINESICYNDTYFEGAIGYNERLNSVICEENIDDEDDDDILVYIPPKSNITYTPINSKERAKFRAPITVSKDMIFIPSDTGDIFVHNLYNGSFIHRFVCPPSTNMNGTYNRPAIKGGVSIVNDRIAFYCGGYWYGAAEIMNGNQFVSIKLNI